MIRIALLDDHPAVRMGLEAALEDEPGFLCVASAGTAAELLGALEHSRPHVVLLDHQLPDADGLHVCRRIKAGPAAPRVVIVSAYAGGALAMAALVAGADAVVGKGARAQEIRDVVRRVAGGDSVRPGVAPDALQEAAARLEPADLPLLGMLLDGTPERDIETVLGVDHRVLDQRIDRLIARMAP